MATQAAPTNRRRLLSRLLDARLETDALFNMVRPEAMYDRPIPERHRIVFYIGHLEAFDWNLFRGPCDLACFHCEFDRLFAFGIDPVGGGLPTDRPQDWPRIREVNAYRERARQALDRSIEAAPLPEDGEGSFGQLLNVAIEHRLMHAETLAYMFHQMPFEHKRGAATARVFQGSSFTPGCVRIPAGRATLGQRRDSRSFGWDNEFEAHTVDVPEFTIDRYKVTNGQFPSFSKMAATRTAHSGRRPTGSGKRRGGSHTRRSGSGAAMRGHTDRCSMRFLSRWIGPCTPATRKRARTRDGLERLCLQRRSGIGRRMARRACHELNIRRRIRTGQPGPVSALRRMGPGASEYAGVTGASAFGVEGLLANGWEWTSTEFAPFPGFRPFACYPGYSAQFFDGKHYVLKGGSVRTASCMLRRSFRNWFQPHYQYVYAGFRCASGPDRRRESRWPHPRKSSVIQ